jgi:hypothetical protein
VTILPGVGNLTGYVTYNNPYSTGLDGVCLQLRNVTTGTVVGNATTGPNTAGGNEPGYYTFANVPSGTYRITATYNGTWGGNNATDALIIQLNVIGSFPLYWLRDTVADVNGSMTKTALDALYVKLRTIGMINSYPAGNWKFTDTTFVHTLTSQVNVKGLCVGDVNGSFIPSGFKDASFLAVNDDETQVIPVGEAFDYDIRSRDVSEIGAMTLFMDYDDQKFEILEIVNAPEGMKYVAEGGRISMAYSDTRSISAESGQPLLSIRMKSKVAISEPQPVFSILPGSEFADPGANRYGQFDLSMPKVVSLGSDHQFAAGNYPNPFRNSTEIVYIIPSAAKVRLVITDMFGQVIRTLTDDIREAGTHRVTVDPSEIGMTPGLYLYRIDVTGEDGNFSHTGKLMYTR